MSHPSALDSEILVVGGGPAGCTAALRLAREGRDVLLVEKRGEGRKKVCGEFVSAEGVAVLRNLGILAPLIAAGAAPIRRTRLVAASGDSFDSLLPEAGGESGLGVSRRLLDETLLASAERAGARVLRGARLVGLSFEGTRWKARVSMSGNPIHVAAPIVLGADGRNSQVARLAGVGGSFSSPGLGVQIHLCRREEPPDRVELLLLHDGYAGLAPVELDRWCLGALLPSSPMLDDPYRRLLSSLSGHPRVRDLLGNPVNILDHCSAYPVRMGLRGSTPRGLFLTGDAAGFLDPFSGQGIALALLAGEAAARAAMDCRVSRARRGYRSFLNRELVPRMAVAASLRRLLEHPGWGDHLIQIFRQHPGLGRRVVGLTRIAGSSVMGSLPRLAGRFLAR
jgi:menaquinone-9 beta-reductase